MRIALLFLLLMPLVGAQAAIYKWVDSRGMVHYSDTPQKGAEEVELQDPTIYSPNQNRSGQPTRSTPPTSSGDSIPYASFVIVSPAKDQVVQANEGRITVTFSTQPGLQEGHYIQPVLDGRIVGQKVYGNKLELHNLTRGGHMIHASIHDAGGRLLARSNIVRFFVRRATVVEDGEAPQPPDSGSSGQSGVDAPQYTPSNQGDFGADPGDSTSGGDNSQFAPNNSAIPRTQGTNPAFRPNY